MKKRVSIFACFLVCLSVLFLAACSGSGGPADAPAPADSTAPTGSAVATPDSTAGTDDVYELLVTQHDPAESATGKFLDAWAMAVNEASEGQLAIEVMHGGSLAGPTESLDMLRSGAVDIAWGLQGFYGGVFPKSEAMMMPMLGIQTAEQGSAAFWELYNGHDFLKDEYEDFQVILLHTGCDCPIGLTSKVEDVAGFTGKTIRANSGPPTSFVQKLGATAEALPIGELYTSLEKGVLDGVVVDWQANGSFKLYEQVDYYLDAHTTVSPYFFLMNKNSYEALPANLQQIIDDYSGEAALEIGKDFWANAESSSIQAIKDQGCEIYTLSDTDTQQMEGLAKEVADEWVAANEGSFPAQEIYDTAKELVDKNAP